MSNNSDKSTSIKKNSLDPTRIDVVFEAEKKLTDLGIRPKVSDQSPSKKSDKTKR